MDKATVTIGIVLLLAGVAFSFLPHETHNTILGYVVHQHSHTREMAEHGNHDLHQKTGYGVALAGLLLTIYGVKRK